MLRSFVLGVVFAALPVTMVPAAPLAQAAIDATQAWSRPAAAGTNGVGYLTVTNRGAKSEMLTAVETPVARTVEMHTSSMAGGVMKMSRETQTPVPAGGSVVFGPGGRHLMLIGLTRALKTGDRFPATLVFASGARLKAEFQVSVTPPAGSSTSNHSMMDHSGMSHEHMGH